MPKSKRQTKAERFQSQVNNAVAVALKAQGAQPPAVPPAPAPNDDEKAEKAASIAAVHATAHFARRNGCPADVVRALQDKARELERQA